MKTTTLEIPEKYTAFLSTLIKTLNTQDECFMRTPLYCVYERARETDEENGNTSRDGGGNGWPTAVFLTDELASEYLKAVSHRLRFPYVFVRGPGEDSDIHPLHLVLKQMRVIPAGEAPMDEKDKARREAIMELAKAKHESEGTLEIDDEALVSEGEDNGAYVQAWVWVSFSGTKFDKEAEEKGAE